MCDVPNPIKWARPLSRPSPAPSETVSACTRSALPRPPTVGQSRQADRFSLVCWPRALADGRRDHGQSSVDALPARMLVRTRSVAYSATAYRRRGDSARVWPTTVSRRKLCLFETRGVNRPRQRHFTVALSGQARCTGVLRRSPIGTRLSMRQCAVVTHVEVLCRIHDTATIVSSRSPVRLVLDTWLILPVVICLS